MLMAENSRTTSPRNNSSTIFYKSLWQGPWATLGLITLLSAIYFWLDYLSAGEPSSMGHLLLMGGAKINSLVKAGEWWRIFSASLLHGSLPHLLINCIGLLILGWFVEAAVGRAYFIILVALSAGGAGLASSIFSDVTSVGASGILFGLMGASVGFTIRFWTRIPKIIRSYSLFIPALGAAGGLISGWSVKEIDNLAHLGGFLVCLIAGGFAPYLGQWKEPWCPLLHSLTGAASLAIILSLSISMGHLNLDLPQATLTIHTTTLDAYEVAYPAGSDWTKGYVSAEGLCVTAPKTNLVDIIEDQGLACFYDSYYTMILIGADNDVKRNPMYIEAFLRDGGSTPTAYQSLELMFHTSTRGLTYGMAVFAPILPRYVGLFKALTAPLGPRDRDRAGD
jgi:membrane associated rhomboid family serine protease